MFHQRNVYWGVAFFHLALYFVQQLTCHPEGPSGFAGTLFQTFFQQATMPPSWHPQPTLYLAVTSGDKVINGTIKQEHFPDATGRTLWLLQLNPCPFRWQLCGLFFKLFPATSESAYTNSHLPQVLSDSCTAQRHWSPAILNLYTSLPLQRNNLVKEKYCLTWYNIPLKNSCCF